MSGRTAAPRFYVVTELALLAYFSVGTLMDIFLENWLHAVIAAVNAVVFFFVVSGFMGWRVSVEDLRLPKLKRLEATEDRA